MREFTISPQGLKLLEKKLTRNSVITLVVVIAIVFVINIFIIGGADQTLIYVGILMVGVMGFSSFNNLKKHKKMFATYKLTVTDDRIIREMDGTPSITI